MGTNLRWDQLWAEFKTMPNEMKVQIAVSLDNGEAAGFERWLAGRSPKAQIDILDNAPDDLKQHFYKRGLLSPFAVFALDIQSHTPVRDRRLGARRV